MTPPAGEPGMCDVKQDSSKEDALKKPGLKASAQEEIERRAQRRLAEEEERRAEMVAKTNHLREAAQSEGGGRTQGPNLRDREALARSGADQGLDPAQPIAGESRRNQAHNIRGFAWHRATTVRSVFCLSVPVLYSLRTKRRNSSFVMAV